MPVNVYNTFDDPSASVGATNAFGINATGQIVGGDGADGFLDSNGTFTNVDDPSAINGTTAHGINAGGEIVGYFGNNGNHGFLDNAGLTPRSIFRRPPGPLH